MSAEQKIRRISVIGSGNVAWQLGHAFKKAGIGIVEICSRNHETGKQLSEALNCPFTDDAGQMNPNTELFLLAVADRAISEYLPVLPADNQLIVHTAGSVGLDILLSGSKNAGVFYPLQTLSKSFPVDFSGIPVCIEASSPTNLHLLGDLAGAISKKVIAINSEQRMLLHIAAVFACNYTNLMYTLASDILRFHELDFELLKPLITETARKAVSLSPELSQTGPAKRNDLEVINNHVSLLESLPEYAEIYRLLADRIKSRFQPTSE